MRNILLFPNPDRDEQLLLTLQIAELLHRFGVVPVLQNDLQPSKPSISLPEYILQKPLPEAIALSNCIICIGGDGTILRIAAPASEWDRPVLGINAGKVGFLAELERHELPNLEQILQGNYFIDRRAMIDVSLVRDGQVLFTERGLNDATVTGHLSTRVIHLNFTIDTHHITRVTGDGLIVSTPTGSSAYSLSAGGPLVDPKADTLLVTPICAHALFAKSFVLSGESSIRIENATAGNPTHLAVDGVWITELQTGDCVEIRKSEKTFALIRLKNSSFYDIIYRKLR